MTLLLFLIWDVNAFSSFLVLCTGGFWCWTRDSDWRKTTALMGHKLQSCTVTLRLESVTLNFNRDWPAHTHKHWVLLWAEYSAGWLSVCVRVLVCELSCVRLFATLWTVAHQVPLSMVFSRQEHRSGLPFPPPGHLPHPELICVSSVNDALAIADPLIDQAPLLVLFHCRAGNRKRKLGRRKCNKSHDYFFPFPLPCHLPLSASQTFLISESTRKSLASCFYPESPVMRNHASAWAGSSAERKQLKFPCSLIWFWGWTAVMLQAQGDEANPMQVVSIRKIQEHDYPRAVTQQGHNIQTSFPRRAPPPHHSWV